MPSAKAPQTFPIYEDDTGKRVQWNGSAYIDLPNRNAPGARYLPPGRTGNPSQSEEAYFNKSRLALDPSVTNAGKSLTATRELEGLLTKQKTGGIHAVPIIGDVVGAFDPEIQRIKGITSEVARSKRQPGEGSTSDFDAKMYIQASPGTRQPTETNRMINRAERLRAENAIAQREMYDWYFDKFGTTRGFSEAWENYRDANTIFDPRSEALGKPILNTKRQNWRQWVGDARGELDTKPDRATADISREYQRAEKTRLKQSNNPVAWDKLTPAAYATAKLSRGTKERSGTMGNPWLPTSPEEFARLPVGSHYINPADGKIKIKPRGR